MNIDQILKEFNGAVTICDSQGIIVYMNEASKDLFKKDGGGQLIGKNVLDCHPEGSRSQLANLLEEPRTNIYSVEKNSIHKLVHQSPWYRDGNFAGLIELVLEVPSQVPHFKRD